MADTHAAVLEHSPDLQHHFDDMPQQFDSSTLGMWVFLLTEIMFFGGMFAAYTIYRGMYPGAFASTSHHMDTWLGAVNTAVLICSSLTMALAVRSAQIGARKLLIWMLVLTMFFGLIFLGIKGVEYYHKYVEHLIPGPGFQYEADPKYFHQAQILFFLYFAMTGFHALHMIVGVGILTTLLVMAIRNRFSPAWYTPVEISGLYWHFVDIVWIFLFPLLYLIGLHAHP
ncbi:MAG: cytochrome c oxidase subunit 3 family protein [Bryobacteraceae bacterium]